MWGFLSEITFDEIVKVVSKPKRSSNSTPHLVYRDVLNKKSTPAAENKVKKQKKTSASGVSKLPFMSSTSDHCEAISEPLLLQRSEDEKGTTMRVKIVMTKEEAARLLSKCKDGGCLQFKDVAREIVNIPVNRVTVVSTKSSCDKVLQSIPEEL